MTDSITPRPAAVQFKSAGGSEARRPVRCALMGPTNVALVKLFRADADLRDAQNRLGEAGKNVRLQERRVADLEAKLKDAQTRLKQQQSRGGQLDLDMRSRDAHIEKLRTQDRKSVV